MSKESSLRVADLIGLFLIALAFNLLLAWPMQQPGTMDSHYYYGGGLSLLENRSFVEPYIWNYLDDPDSLPTPSHRYWMPLPSILVALAQHTLGSTFRAAQMPFAVLAAGIPLISYATSWQLSSSRLQAWTAGLLTAFSGFYVPFWSLPETFAPIGLTGGLALFFLGRLVQGDRPGPTYASLAVGMLAGLAHLCRADGLLILATALIVAIMVYWNRPGKAALLSLIILVGYLSVMALWFTRNWRLDGTLLPTAGTKTIFLKSYDELFSYGTPLSWTHYLDWGWRNILLSKLAAAWDGLQTLLAVNCMIFLAPVFAIGIWSLRRHRPLWPALLFSAALYSAMTLVFTFPGVRGGLFHSSAALLPTITAVSLVGLKRAVTWIAGRRRAWDERVAFPFLGVGLVVLSLGLSLLLYGRQVIGSGTWGAPAWNNQDAAMQSLGNWIQEHENSDQLVVMVGNPPAFHYHTGLSAIVAPNEGVELTLAAADRYGARYLVLDQNRPAPLAALYDGTQTHPRLLHVWGGNLGGPHRFQVFQIAPPFAKQMPILYTNVGYFNHQVEH